ncbi:MAG: hypothetical protein VX127_00945 [Myxococcota bacterium]|nr:hypothetical protein [Myxococcota bacterium]
MNAFINASGAMAALLVPATAHAEVLPDDRTPQWTVEANTAFPIRIGADASAEWTRARIRVSTGLGWLPGAYIDAINGVAQAAGWYDGRTASLIEAGLQHSTVWPLSVHWRPIAQRGLTLSTGTQLAALGGGLGAVDVLSALTASPAPEGVEAGRTMTIDSSLWMMTAGVGWSWQWDSVVVRADIGGAFTVGSSTTVAPNWTPPRRTQRAVDALAGASESYLDETYRRYVHTGTVHVSVGWAP